MKRCGLKEKQKIIRSLDGVVTSRPHARNHGSKTGAGGLAPCVPLQAITGSAIATTTWKSRVCVQCLCPTCECVTHDVSGIYTGVALGVNSR